MHRWLRCALVAAALGLPSATAGAGELFRPGEACRALELEGLGTEGWRESLARPGNFFCISRPLGFGPIGPDGRPSTLTYEALGSQPGEVDQILIKVFLFAPGTEVIAHNKLAKAAETLFAQMDEEMPYDLARALAERKPGRYGADWGMAILDTDLADPPGERLTLLSRRLLDAKSRRVAAAASDMKACRAAVARIAGYPEDDVVANTEPLWKGEQVSVRLEGRDGDMFVCETTPGGRYRLLAAFKGRLPFTYLDEGALPEE